MKKEKTAFDDWQEKNYTEISPTLFWDYDLKNFNWYNQENKIIVVQRVIERGKKQDIYATIRKYGGLDSFIEILKKVPHFNDIDLNYVSKAFNIPLNDLKCYTNKQLRKQLFSF